MSPSRLTLIAICTSALAACSLPMTGLEVQRSGVSASRPTSTIGSPESEGEPPWQTYTVKVPSGLADMLVRLDSTFHLVVSDCRHPDGATVHVDGSMNTDGLIGIEDVYINGVTLNGSSTAHYKPSGREGSFLRGVAYLSTSWIKDARKLCFRAMGGSMFGVGFKSNISRIPG